MIPDSLRAFDRENRLFLRASDPIEMFFVILHLILDTISIILRYTSRLYRAFDFKGPVWPFKVIGSLSLNL